jgi:hypothetical protein
MKKKTIYMLAFLLISAMFLGSCKKDFSLKSRISSLDSLGTVSTFATGSFDYITTDKNGNVYALHKNYAADTIYKFNASGTKTLFYTPPVVMDDDTAVINTLANLTTDSAGNIYAINYNGLFVPSVIKITPAGAASTIFSNITYGNGFQIQKIAIDASGNFYFNNNAGIVYKITPGGAISIILNTAYIFTVDKNMNIIYSENWDDVEKITPQGVKSTLAGPGKILYAVTDITTDRHGNIFIGESIGNQAAIQKINTTDTLSKIISSTLGHVDGPIATAKIAAPFSLTIDALGNIYFSEINGTPADIRKITF